MFDTFNALYLLVIILLTHKQKQKPAIEIMIMVPFSSMKTGHEIVTENVK